MDLADLDYELPPELVAQHPLPERDSARLLVLERDLGKMEHRSVRDLPELLRPALIVVNDTRVLPARLLGHKKSGGQAELLLLSHLRGSGARERWLAMGRASKRLRPESEIQIADDFSARIIERREDGTLEIELSASATVRAAIEAHGHVPLPPYIRRQDEHADRERYQTLFAAHDGSVAAPTAGLHFTPALMAALAARGHVVASVTLHVGPGTFRPVQSETLAAHPMHAERYEISSETAAAWARARAEGRPVVAIGTTVVRALESALDGDGRLGAGSGSTQLFIHPPYRLRSIDALLTNFHLPRSTLLALVMAFAGIEPVQRAYRAALEERYRFYSYGDAMLIRGAETRA